MFVQMFTGKVIDAAGSPRRARRLARRGRARCARDGWARRQGITDDGQLVAFARFESQEAARANSDRPEQGRWWESLAANLDGEATFFESGEVDEDIVGDPDTAGFVQVMRGRVSDPARARELGKADPGAWARVPPGHPRLAHPRPRRR